MNALFKQILNIKEAAALPNLRESGGLPVLVSGLSAVHRSNLAAALADRTEKKLFIICPDDTSAENFSADINSMLGEEAPVLGVREFAVKGVETASHLAEQARIATLYSLAAKKNRIHVVSVPGLIQRTLSPENLLSRAFTIESTGTYSPESIVEKLVNCGYSRSVQVEGPGQFAQRGGILDFFSPSAHEPVRIEFWGDEIDSMASFDILSQRRNDPLGSCLILPSSEDISCEFSTAVDYIPYDAALFIDRPARCAEAGREYIKTLEPGYYLSYERIPFENYPVYMADAFSTGNTLIEPKTIISIQAKQLPSYAGNAQTAAEDAKQLLKSGYALAALAGDERRAGVLCEYLNGHDVPSTYIKNGGIIPVHGQCLVYTGSISAGLEYPGIKLAILTDAQLIRKKTRHQNRRKLPKGRERIENCADLSPGDYVVHESHGIGKFIGVVRMEVEGYDKDYIKIAYAGSDVVYVPATALDLVSKYTGAGEEANIKLSKLGGVDWEKKRSRAKGAAKIMAKKLINLYAQRLKTEGHAFAPDNEWQREFEENFGYTETDDQLRCIAEIKENMESSTPMDRLLCGDVGVGKTEVALRAVMKCILDGRQAAILAPTTVLAQQHYQTAMQRFFGFPVNIEVLSRFSAGAGTTRALKNIASGKCDLAIGTHRLLSKDVHFNNLGLLVVDEEQRFGVTHKEHIKELAKGVDVLTLSATPIPRTMNMAMSGIRDVSMIEEPPEDRQPVQTFVLEHDWDVIADAINRELRRGGQVYYLHNRIDDIERTASILQEKLGDISIEVAHGRMDRQQLSETMDRVVAGEIQVLVCTTIIETGIDIPNVNTLIIEDADRLGLAQLHQIRGRVGRSSRKASAYLTFRKNKVLTEDAEKRLNAVRDFAQFGSGFKIALRDLEIRGAGNLLGAEQSGHMSDVGYEVYMKLLNEAVLEEKGIEIPQRADCSADLAVSASIPERYVESAEHRMDIYRRIALIRTEEEADDLLDELIDRFGDPPPGVNSLIQVALLRGEAGAAGITDISQKHGELKFIVRDFNMQKVTDLYAKDEYKGRLRVDAGSKPCLALKIKNKAHVIEESRRFVKDWGDNKGEQKQ